MEFFLMVKKNDEDETVVKKVREKSKKSSASKAGFFFYPGDWLSSEVRSCSLAAKGLWIDMLAVMWRQEMRGCLLIDDLQDLAELMAPGGLAEAWMAMSRPYIDELERKGVFSRGVDIEESGVLKQGDIGPGDLPPDAIVNRRMFREWYQAEGRKAKASNAIRVRWERERARRAEEREKERVSVDEIRAEMQDARYSGDTKALLEGAEKCGKNAYLGDTQGGSGDDTQAILESEAETVGEEQVTEESEYSGDTRNSESGILRRYLSKPNHTKPIQPKEEIEYLGNVIPLALREVTGKDIFGRICYLTGVVRRDAWGKWWKEVVRVFEKAGRHGDLIPFLEKAERDIDLNGDPLGDRRKFLVARTLEAARIRKLKVPDHPLTRKANP